MGEQNLPIELPQWQKDLIDKRLNDIADNPSSILPIDQLIAVLNTDD